MVVCGCRWLRPASRAFRRNACWHGGASLVSAICRQDWSCVQVERRLADGYGSGLPCRSFLSVPCGTTGNGRIDESWNRVPQVDVVSRRRRLGLASFAVMLCRSDAVVPISVVGGFRRNACSALAWFAWRGDGRLLLEAGLRNTTEDGWLERAIRCRLQRVTVERAYRADAGWQDRRKAESLLRPE